MPCIGLGLNIIVILSFALEITLLLRGDVYPYGQVSTQLQALRRS